MVDASKIILLQPEIVNLELEKSWAFFSDGIKTEYEKLEKGIKEAIKNTKVWNELDDIKNAVLPSLEENKKKKLEKAAAYYEEIRTFLSSPKIKNIPFTIDVWFAAKKRLISGKTTKANPEGKIDSDLSIIESLARFFGTVADKDASLYFCSENTKEFALDLGNDKCELHPNHTGLRRSKYFKDLNAMIAFAKTDGKIVEPSPQEVETALEKERLTSSDGLSQHEIVALAAITSALDTPEEYYSAYRIKQDMEASGYTKVAATLALRSLKKQKYISQRFLRDPEIQETYLAYTLTEKGWDWVLANQDRFNLTNTKPRKLPRKPPPPPPDDFDDEPSPADADDIPSE